MSDYWVFGYGSLMWDPGFAFIERRFGRLPGFHRQFCLYSMRYRGTPQLPGLVLGLDAGGDCHGVVFRVAASEAAAVKAYLWEREMSNAAYQALMLPVETRDGPVEAQVFVINRATSQYAGGLSAEDTARLIATSHGERGSNCTYLFNTIEHLQQMGIEDAALSALAARVRSLQAAGGCSRPDHPVFTNEGF
jgi:cation transport protein ChaC